MKKQKTIISIIIALGMFVAVRAAFAAGSATVSWTPPTTDEGGGTLTGLAGYRILYDTSSHWTSSCDTGLGSYVDVPGGSVSNYTFENILTAGQHYYFTVVAYDDASTPNYSECSSDGTDTEVDKVVLYTADINDDGDVNSLDFNAFRNGWGNTTCNHEANFVGKTSSCTVNSLDFNALRNNWSSPDLTP